MSYLYLCANKYIWQIADNGCKLYGLFWEIRQISILFFLLALIFKKKRKVATIKCQNNSK